MKVLACITIDTEADHDTGWRKTSPLRFRSVTESIPALYTPLFAEFGAHPTYLLTTEVLADAASVDALRRTKNAELGTHLHGDHVAPALRVPAEGAKSSDFTCYFPEGVERAKLETITKQFVDCFGRRPRSYRAGRYAASAQTLRSLAELGYTVDTSVTPGVLWVHEDRPEERLDFRAAPLFPYRPSATDLTRPGDEPVWEVPVTIVPPPRVLSRATRLAQRALRRPPQEYPLWFRPSTTPLPLLAAALASTLREAHRQRRSVAVVNIMFHSMEVLPGASPYSATPAGARGVVRRLREMLRMLRAVGARFVPLSAVPDFVSSAAP